MLSESVDRGAASKLGHELDEGVVVGGSLAGQLHAGTEVERPDPEKVDRREEDGTLGLEQVMDPVELALSR